jgi:hypothetical protein
MSAETPSDDVFAIFTATVKPMLNYEKEPQ